MRLFIGIPFSEYVWRGLGDRSDALCPQISKGRGIRYVANFEKLTKGRSPEPFCDKIERIALFHSTRIKGKLCYVTLLTKML